MSSQPPALCFFHRQQIDLVHNLCLSKFYLYVDCFNCFAFISFTYLQIFNMFALFMLIARGEYCQIHSIGFVVIFVIIVVPGYMFRHTGTAEVGIGEQCDHRLDSPELSGC